MRMAVFSSGTKIPGCGDRMRLIRIGAVVQMRSELQQANSCSSSASSREV
jgi:hypothetical protein